MIDDVSLFVYRMMMTSPQIILGAREIEENGGVAVKWTSFVDEYLVETEGKRRPRNYES